MSSEPEEAMPPVSEGGTIGAHTLAGQHDLFVAPATAAEFNTIVRRREIRACWRVEDIRFAFDSSFVLPEAATEMRRLAYLIRKHSERDRKPPLSLFGHADPVGKDDYNKQLSGRRAAAVYALLTRDAAIWEDIYSQNGAHTARASGDDWGTRSVQTMLRAVGHDPGPIDGVAGDRTKAAARDFQRAVGLAEDGIIGPRTREKLFLVYMDRLCGAAFTLSKADFLARGADPHGKGDYQGCGEFNPVLMSSQAESEEFSQEGKKALRDAENAPNRRVMAFLFRPGDVADPAFWPCPRAKEGGAGCRLRFWSDAPARRGFQVLRRENARTHDTFACRFYDRIANDSPCERGDPIPLPFRFSI